MNNIAQRRVYSARQRADCRKTGNIEKARRINARTAVQPRSTNLVSYDRDKNVLEPPMIGFNIQELNAVRSSVVVLKFLVALKIEGRALEFEVDSRATFTVISQDTYRRTWPNKPPPLHKEYVTLQTWTGEGLQVLGSAQVRVRHKSKDSVLPLMVATGTGWNLIGRNWFPAL